MKISRLLAATVPGVVYPSLVAVVAAGVFTFTATKVFAESAPLPACSHPEFSECSTELAACTTCGSSACACVSSVCWADAGQTESKLACQDMGAWTCDGPRFANCAGKVENEACGDASHCVTTGGCRFLDSGTWRDETRLVCIQDPPAWDATVGPRSDDGGHLPDAGRGDDAAPPTSSEQAGCSLAAPSTSTSVLASSTLTFAVAMLWRLRRRRR